MKSPLGFWSWTNRRSKLEKVFDPLRICGSLFSLIFVSIAATALFIYILEHWSPKIPLQRVRPETRMPKCEICKTGALGVLSHFLILTPCSVSCFLWTTFQMPIVYPKINFAQILSKPPFSVCNGMPYLDSGNVSSPSESSSILDMCCHLPTGSSACDSAT